MFVLPPLLPVSERRSNKELFIQSVLASSFLLPLPVVALTGRKRKEDQKSKEWEAGRSILRLPGSKARKEPEAGVSFCLSFGVLTSALSLSLLKRSSSPLALYFGM